MVEQFSKRTNVRYIILFLIFIVTTFNYVDRATLSIAAPVMRREFGFDAVTMGFAFSAFGWAYTWMQLPGGWILDKYGPRLVYGLGLLLWSVFTFMQGLVGQVGFVFLALFLLRFLMGTAEAPAFPANNRLTVMWFPTRERGFATAVFSCAQYVAMAIFTPLMTLTLQVWSWHYIFFWTGGVGVVLAGFWLHYVRSPRGHPAANAAEIAYIEAGGGLPSIGERRKSIDWRSIRRTVSNRMMIGIYIGQFCLTTISWFFLTWFPTYLLEAKGMSILKAGMVTAIPGVAGFLGGMVGGLFSDWLLRRGNTLTVARKTPIIAGLLLSSTIVLANYVESAVVVVIVMSVAFFAKGFGNIGWAILGDVSPKETLGINGGIFNFCGNIASIVTPITIGYILQVSGSFNLALLYVGSMSIVGALSYIFIVGDVKRLDAEAAPLPAAQALPELR